MMVYSFLTAIVLGSATTHLHTRHDHQVKVQAGKSTEIAKYITT